MKNIRRFFPFSTTMFLGPRILRFEAFTDSLHNQDVFSNSCHKYLDRGTLLLFHSGSSRKELTKTSSPGEIANVNLFCLRQETNPRHQGFILIHTWFFRFYSLRFLLWNPINLNLMCWTNLVWVYKGQQVCFNLTSVCQFSPSDFSSVSLGCCPTPGSERNTEPMIKKPSDVHND